MKEGNDFGLRCSACGLPVTLTGLPGDALRRAHCVVCGDRGDVPFESCWIVTCRCGAVLRCLPGEGENPTNPGTLYCECHNCGYSGDLTVLDEQAPKTTEDA